MGMKTLILWYINVAGLMGLDNFDYASTAFDRWLRYTPQSPRARNTEIPAAAAGTSTRRILILDTATNKQLLQRLLNAG